MSKVVVLNHVTLDGVMQAPGRPDEDRRDGFAHGGWARPRGDSVSQAFGGIGEVGGLLFGRRTYEDFFSFWPNQTDNPFTAVLNTTQKYVASTTLVEPLLFRWLDPAVGRCRRCRGQAQAAARQGSLDYG
jgi:dihydrofolate reductase